MKRASEFRAQAREALSGRWGAAVLATSVAGLLGADITMSGGGSASGLGSSVGKAIDKQTGSGSGDINSFSGSFPSFSTSALIYMMTAVMVVFLIVAAIGIIRFIVGSFVSLGLIQYNLDMIDGKEVEFGQIFSKSSMLGKAVWLRLRMVIFTFLWTLLLIIPGIIKAYSYSMAGFIMTENPEMSAKEAMEVSMKMMDGNKWRLFCLEISFIGWMILSIFTLGVGLLWVVPYENAATAAFYDEISRKPII